VSDLVLIADDDRDIVRFVEVNLKLEGFRVATAHDGDDALTKALTLAPDLVLLDVMMPRMDGYEVCSRLRADSRSAGVPIIMLTAKSLSADKVLGLTAGADDYIIKPFDPMELVERVRSTLERTRERSASPAGPGTPTGAGIEQEIADRLRGDGLVAVAVAGIDHLQPFAERYGAARAGELAALAASVLSRAVEEAAGPGCYVGQASANDFVVILPADRAADFARRAVAGFDVRIPGLYDPEDAAAGTLEYTDATGRRRREPVATISIGVSTGSGATVADPTILLADAAELRDMAERQPGSSWAGV
jgi:CheY-like chemotaxis protein